MDDEVRARVQKDGESVDAYINHMLLIYKRMKVQPSDRQKVERLYWNMRKEFHTLLRPYLNISLEGFIHRASEFGKAFAAGQERPSTDKIEKKPEEKPAETSKENKKKIADVQALSISSREELQKILAEELAKLGYTKKNSNQRADNQNYRGSRNNQNFGNSREQNNYNQGWQHSGNYRGRYNNRGNINFNQGPPQAQQQQKEDEENYRGESRNYSRSGYRGRPYSHRGFRGRPNYRGYRGYSQYQGYDYRDNYQNDGFNSNNRYENNYRDYNENNLPIDQSNREEITWPNKPQQQNAPRGGQSQRNSNRGSQNNLNQRNAQNPADNTEAEN